MKQPKREKMPRLHPDVKAMNGRSTRRLSQSIDALTSLLDAHEEKDVEVIEEPETSGDSE
jgi:hypothetical protein